ncbi:uncharacterized protein KIAA1958 homolog [Pecten maximus]|uniref:uncharacterized protein KIAA1958 homolog n=1 Tax=Pecten maximus TaxID=6579 RepID=UPI0014589915|nr:uncharacterized protein KIAA1958 homolog [Pecten maximus]
MTVNDENSEIVLNPEPAPSQAPVPLPVYDENSHVPRPVRLVEIPDEYDGTLMEIVQEIERNENELQSVETTKSVRPPTQSASVVPRPPSPSQKADPVVHDPVEQSKQFVELNMEDVEAFIEGQANKNTMKKTLQDVKLVKQFLALKGEEREMNEIPVGELDMLLANFLLSVRKKDGQNYEPSSLRGIISSVDRKLCRQKYGHKIMNGDANEFALTRDALKAKQKVLKKEGKGNRAKKSEPITDTEIQILYEKKLLGPSTPESLLNTVWLNNSLHFGLRGMQEHYNLKWGDVQLKSASDGTEYLELNERQTKTLTGENLCDVRQVSPKMFATNDTDCDPINIYKRYAAHRPMDYSNSDDPFYISTRTIPLSNTKSDKWFIQQRIEEKKLGSLMKTMAQKGNLDKDKKLTNHSARKHLVQKLRDANVPPTDIMQISGHKNVQSIINYSSISETQQRSYSNMLATHRETGNPVNLNPSSEMNFTHVPSVHNASSTSSITQANSQLNSIFYGATLHINNLNIYTSNPM